MHETQQFITLTEAAKLTPGRPSANCVWRWCRKGVLARDGQRIRLHHTRVGGKIFTTAKWVSEFGEKLAQCDAAYFDNNVPPVEPRRLRRRAMPQFQQHRAQQIERARQSLAAAGI